MCKTLSLRELQYPKKQGGNPVSIAGCPAKRAMPRLILGLINPAYLQVFSASEVASGQAKNPTEQNRT